jgi:Undecaprenyl-phosphate glucose phosphotransferase
MLKQYQRFFSVVFQVFDLFLVSLAWLVAFPVRFLLLKNLFPIKKGFPTYHQYAYLTFAIIVIWYVVFHFAGVYKNRRTQSIWPELWAVTRASLVGFIVLSAGTFLVTAELFSRGVLLVFIFISVFLFIFQRITFRVMMKNLRRKGYNLRSTLIVGDNEIGAAFLERLRFHPELGLVVKGVVRLRDSDETSSHTGLPIVGTSLNLTEVLKTHRIDQVILALKNSQQEQLDELLSSLADQSVDARIIPDLHQFITLGCEVEEFEGLPLISLNQSPIVGWNRIAKRISDIFYAILALLIFSPIMILISLAIKLFTPGPIIHRQERMGLDGHVFQMLKFRTMRIDAEKISGPVWTTKNDDRVTWIGKFLRRASLDELPQLINVLRGDMSCVGPRPERPALVEKFRHDIPRYMLRHKVKSGMTGWAQINGWRGDTSLEKRIEYDLYYISNWSLFFDFKIMLITIFKGFVSKNAY